MMLVFQVSALGNFQIGSLVERKLNPVYNLAFKKLLKNRVEIN